MYATPHVMTCQTHAQHNYMYVIHYITQFINITTSNVPMTPNVWNKCNDETINKNNSPATEIKYYCSIRVQFEREDEYTHHIDSIYWADTVHKHVRVDHGWFD